MSLSFSFQHSLNSDNYDSCSLKPMGSLQKTVYTNIYTALPPIFVTAVNE